MKQIPNLFTLLNLVFGSLAVIFILQTGEGIVVMNNEEVVMNLPEKIWWGSICIGLAALVDFLDGFLARLMRVSSEMGKQLDSLADMVSFGLAPGLILYQLLRLSYAQLEAGLDVQLLALLPALLVPCAAAWRLAKFNLDPGQAFHFKGIPTPAAGLLVASLPLILWYNYFGGAINVLLLNRWLLYALCLLLSWLMVSNLPVMSLKFKSSGQADNMPKIIVAVVAIVAAIFLKWLAVPVVFLAYILISLLYKNKLV